jgi:hypothetical protein
VSAAPRARRARTRPTPSARYRTGRCTRCRPVPASACRATRCRCHHAPPRPACLRERRPGRQAGPGIRRGPATSCQKDARSQDTRAVERELGCGGWPRVCTDRLNWRSTRPPGQVFANATPTAGDNPPPSPTGASSARPGRGQRRLHGRGAPERRPRRPVRLGTGGAVGASVCTALRIMATPVPTGTSGCGHSTAAPFAHSDWLRCAAFVGDMRPALRPLLVGSLNLRAGGAVRRA